MRLFIAIDFDKPIREELMGNIEDLQTESKEGSFTDEDNLHLTLVFIGETRRDELKYLKEAMIRAVSNTEVGGLLFTLAGYGFFKGKGKGRTYYRAIEENEKLEGLQWNLVRELEYQGFILEKRRFTPHITLARRCVVWEDFDEEWFEEGLNPVSMTARKVTLFESSQLGGKSVYTPIYSLDI